MDEFIQELVKREDVYLITMYQMIQWMRTPTHLQGTTWEFQSFYRWISERYPCLSEVVKDYQIPEFDNLYLDFNGVVHVCSHPEDNNPHFRITEEKIFQDIFHYIEVLFRMIRPRKVFFMAIDGVAPRAKMNQQRGRRFRSAREAEDLIRKALEAGEVLPKEKRFDSNCITPGTPFMVRLQEQLKYFISKKVTTDKMWENVSVYLSGHETPGEGEHKIMDFIRYEKAQPGYDPNTRHCLYGLDADLIMLGLASHEPHFSLLREEVRFGVKESQKRSTAPEETTFHLLHLSLLREYLDFEFAKLKETLPFKYDLEHIIDDWVLMGFLVGNDFIPHLPHIHIHEEALPVLWRTYMEVLPTLDGYLNEYGTLNLARFEKYLTRLSQRDIDQFAETQADEKWMQSKVAAKHVNDELGQEGQKLHRHREKQLQKFDGIPTANEFMALMELEPGVNGSTAEVKSKSVNKDLFGESDCSEGNDVEEESELEEVSEEDDFDTDFRSHKDNYYMDKMKLQATPEVLRDQAHGYVRAIQWILYYYFNGCPSWSWYYPHHYAPYMSDVKDFADMKMEFDYGVPFLPFQQLMAVLPSASKNLLPDAYKPLMCDDNSPVIDYYPVKFDTDLNGKKQDWEAVVLIPFIEENRLLSAMESVEHLLEPDEVARNIHSPHLMYRKSDETLGVYPSPLPEAFPDIVNNRAQETKIDKHHFVLPAKQLHHHLCDGVKLDVYYPGFPTMKHIKHTANLRKESVKVFQQNSRFDNMMLTITPPDTEPDAKQVAPDILGKSVYVGWPHLFEAKCIKVSTDEECYILEGPAKGARGKRQIGSRDLSSEEGKFWRRDVKTITDNYRCRRGVVVGDTSILVYAQPMSGRRYICSASGKITLEKQYLERSEAFLYQTCCKDIAVKDPTFTQFSTVNQLFPANSEVFMLGSPHYGAMGKVLEVDSQKNDRIRIDFSILQEPDFSNIWHREKYLATQYMPGNQIARRLAVSTHMVSRITGTLFVTKGSKELATNSRVNIGLNLKFNKKNEQVAGFTLRTEDGWLYSKNLLQDLGKYISTFPELFDYISKRLDHEAFYDEDIFGDNSESRMKELNAFLKELPCAKVPPSSCRSEVLDDLVVKEIEKEMDHVRELNRKKKRRLKMLVRPHLLYRPLDAQATVVPDTSVTFQLYDRVVNVREGYSVPLGLRGTICGIHPAEKEQDTFYAVLFDEEFMGALTISGCTGRGYRMPSCTLINISHGERREQEKSGYASKPTAVVKPQTSQRMMEPQGPYHHQQQQQHHHKQEPRRDYQRHDEAPRYTNNDRSNVEKQRQGGNQARFNRQQQQGNKQQVDFANVWQQLQAGMKFEPAQPPKSAPASSSINSQQGQGQSQGHFTTAPSLQQAAKVLHVSQLEAPVSNPGASASSSEGTDEFSKLMKSLELSEKKQPSPSKSEASTASSAAEIEHAAQLRDSTAALCQMLKIGQPASAKPDDQPPTSEDSSKPVYGKQLSVNDLFEGAKKKGASGAFMGLPPDVSQPPPGGHGQYAMGGSTAASKPNQSQPPNQQQQQQQQRHQKRSRVTELLQWCQAMGIAEPTYNTNRQPDGRFTTVVTLGNGMRYHGSKAKTEQQACESAAGNALMSNSNSMKSGPPPPTSLPFGQRSEEGPRGAFSASPNSAFTPVRPGGKPVFQPPPLMSMPPPHFMQGGYGQPPMGGGRGPQGFMHQGHQGHRPWDPRQQQWLRNQWNPAWGQQGPGWMPPGQGRPNMGQGQPRYGQVWNQHQHQFHNQGWGQQYPSNQGHHGNQYGRHGGQRRESESDNMASGVPTNRRPEPKQWHDNSHNDHHEVQPPRYDSQPEDRIPPEPKTPSKNPFVPLQVEKKQKTPQRETRKEPREHSNGQGKESSPRTPEVPSTYDIKPRAVEPFINTTPSEKTMPENNPAAKSENVTSPEKSQQPSTSGQTPPRRPKSRIAAKFGPC